jgi:asparagine synthetase B (glutamine-hydrolysing)
VCHVVIAPPLAGVLLSGGLDSSLVAAIAARKIKRESSVWGKLHSFCVGLPGSPDLKVIGWTRGRCYLERGTSKQSTAARQRGSGSRA